MRKVSTVCPACGGLGLKPGAQHFDAIPPELIPNALCSVCDGKGKITPNKAMDYHEVQMKELEALCTRS